MKIQFLGQNCFLFHYKNKTILSDPFYNYQKEKSQFDIHSQAIDYVIVTHAHGDHIADVQEVLDVHPEVILVGQPEICAYFKHKNSLDINFGGSAKFDGMRISMVPASHTSSFPDGSYGGEPCGYIFRYEGKNLYLAGDTGIMADMAYFTPYYGEITTAILPVGKHYTMCPNKAAFAASDLLKCTKVIGCHFDTFPAITINHEEAYESFRKRNVELILPKLGEEIQL